MGAERIIAMSRHKMRQELAMEYGATDIVTERGDAVVANIFFAQKNPLGGPAPVRRCMQHLIDLVLSR